MMYNHQREQLNITEESNLMISIGCSFTEGQGAIPDHLWRKYDFRKEKRGDNVRFDELDIEHENAFVSQLCKYYATDYTPINLGHRGKGNKPGIKELTTFSDDLNLQKAKNIIVILFSTEQNRLDLVMSDNHEEHRRFETIWPHDWDGLKSNPTKKWWDAYRDNYTELMSVVEWLLNVRELQMWCELYGAKLVVSSAFSQHISEDHFNEVLSVNDFLKKYKNIFDWDKYFFKPHGYNTFSDLLCSFDEKLDESYIGNMNFYNYFYENGGYPGSFWTGCAHPSVKGHRLIAETFHNYFIENGFYE